MDEKPNTLDARYVWNPDDGPEALPLQSVKTSYLVVAAIVVALVALISSALIRAWGAS